MRKISIKFHPEAKQELAIITFVVIFEYIKLKKKKKKKKPKFFKLQSISIHLPSLATDDRKQF